MVSDIAALNFMYHVEQQACGIVNEPVAVHAAVLLAMKVYPVLEARRQPGADGLRVVVPAVHGYDACSCCNAASMVATYCLSFLLRPSAIQRCSLAISSAFLSAAV